MALKVPGSLISLKYITTRQGRFKVAQESLGSERDRVGDTWASESHLSPVLQRHRGLATHSHTSASHVGKSNSVPGQGLSNPPSWSLLQGGALWAVEGDQVQQPSSISQTCQPRALTWDVPRTWLRPRVCPGCACYIHSCRKPFMNGVSVQKPADVLETGSSLWKVRTASSGPCSQGAILGCS